MTQKRFGLEACVLISRSENVFNPILGPAVRVETQSKVAEQPLAPCFNHHTHHQHPALLCVLQLSHHLPYPQPLPTRTILTGTGSPPPKEAVPSDAGRLNCRRRAHHQGKQPPCLSRTRAQSQGMRRCKERASRKAGAAEAQDLAAEGCRAGPIHNGGRTPRPFPFIPRRPPCHLALGSSSSRRIRLHLLTTLSPSLFLFFKNSTAPSLPRPPPQPSPPHTLLLPSTRPASSPSPSSWS